MEHKIKARIVVLGIRSMDVIKEIERRGESCCPSMFSNAINGNYAYPKHRKLAEMANQILTEWEADPTKIRRS